MAKKLPLHTLPKKAAAMYPKKAAAMYPKKAAAMYLKKYAAAGTPCSD